jgi:hypothetical protein
VSYRLALQGSFGFSDGAVLEPSCLNFLCKLETKRAKYEQETNNIYNNKANNEDNKGVKEEVYRMGLQGNSFGLVTHCSVFLAGPIRRARARRLHRVVHSVHYSHDPFFPKSSDLNLNFVNTIG